MRMVSLAIAFALLAAGSAEAAELTITVTNISKEPGPVYLVLFDEPENFRKIHRSRAKDRVVARPDGTARFRFSDLVPGRYAAIAFHDTDWDGELDLVLGMFPTEGTALSNDPKLNGPPQFEASAFAVTGPATRTRMRMDY